VKLAEPLWTHVEARLFADLTSDAVWFADGIQIDSREVLPGDLFVALPGSQANGHDFVNDAIKRGAIAAVVEAGATGFDTDNKRLLKTDDTKVALNRLAKQARSRMLGPVIAVTGSAGKTSVVQALASAIGPGADVHTSIRSFNNQVGVPLSMARMPRGTRFGIFEIGMSNPGEIAPLAEMVAPDVALVTTISSAHQANFSDLAAIAAEKSAIFGSLKKGGTAIIGIDHPCASLLIKKAKDLQLKTVTVSAADTSADVHVVKVSMQDNCSCVIADVEGVRISYKINEPGEHWILNSLLVLAAVRAAGSDLGLAGLSLATWSAGSGRGRTSEIERGFGHFRLIDESYNANPASLKAGLACLASRKAVGQKYAVLADMQELGSNALSLHMDCIDDLKASGVCKIFAVGEMMTALAEKAGMTVESFDQVDDALHQSVERQLNSGDVLYIKGANSWGLGKLVDTLLHWQDGRVDRRRSISNGNIQAAE